jgi:hypothetical protein
MDLCSTQSLTFHTSPDKALAFSYGVKFFPHLNQSVRPGKMTHPSNT